MIGSGKVTIVGSGLAGTLMAVGRSELDRDAVAEALQTGIRPTAAVTAPACGLTLISVHYE